MLLSLLNVGGLFAMSLFGLGWPVAARLGLAPPAKMLAAALLGLLGIFLWSWVIYVAKLPWLLIFVAPAAGAWGCLSYRPLARDFWQNQTVRNLGLAQAAVSTGCLGWLAVVTTYSGGGWSGDWFEHWERARFFAERWPLNTQFLTYYSLTARPPLSNIVTASFLQLTRNDFAHFQVISTVLSSLAFLPAALLAIRWRPGSTTIAAVAVLFLLNPSFLENATFTWTKLPTAFFVLTGLYFFLHGADLRGSRTAAILTSLSFGGGLLAHYSAGPYIVVLMFAALCLRAPGAWRARLISALWFVVPGALLVACWFGWAFLNYGLAHTLADNSSVRGAAVTTMAQVETFLLNLRDTLVPHFFRQPNDGLITQTSSWGYWRDWWFQLYQVNLLFAFGSVAWMAILAAAWRQWNFAALATRRFWLIFVVGTVGLGLAVHTGRDQWGLAHICLQPLVLLGLAFLASQWTGLSSPWRLVLVTGAAFDFVNGIFLQFGVENYALDRWFTPTRPFAERVMSYNASATMNLMGKLQSHLVFFGDQTTPTGVLTIFGLSLLLLVTINYRRTSPR